MQCNEVINQQVNDAISQVAAFVENVLPKKDSDTIYALARVASTASEKMMINFSALTDTQSRDDIPSTKKTQGLMSVVPRRVMSFTIGMLLSNKSQPTRHWPKSMSKASFLFTLYVVLAPLSVSSRCC